MWESGHPYGAANRIYYACFYATVALLLTRNLSSLKHSGVMALFNRHFVRGGLCPWIWGNSIRECSIIAWRATTERLSNWTEMT